MNRIYHDIRQMFKGTGTVDAQTKYMMISIGIALIHLVFTIGFLDGQIMSLFWYNLAVTLFYLYHSFVSIRRERYVFVYISSVVEILFHASFASLMLGWDWGFAMYTMAIIPATFYLTYTLPQFNGKLYVPTWSSTIVSSCFILVRAACGRMDPLYQGVYSDNMKICFYYFNIIIALVMLVLFSSLFALEISYMQKQLEQENYRLGEVANFDPLTHLLNRRSMNTQLKTVHEEALQHEQMFCVMLVDIDDFKKVNDSYGHDCGDEVLVSIANVILGDVREEDAVCRWGGEEILVLLRADLDIARKVAERICKDVRDTVIQHNNIEVGVTVTIGVADYKKNQTVRFMIEEADRNMYYGKHHGKNQVVTSYERLEDSI